MKHYRVLVCMVALGSLLLAACGQTASPATPTLPAPTDAPASPVPTVALPAPAADASALVGRYNLAENEQKILDLVPDGTLSWWDNYGTYTVDGNQITFVDKFDCTEPGVYEWSLDGTKLKLRPVGTDPCETRLGKMLTWWVKQMAIPYVAAQRLTHSQDLAHLAVDRQGNLYTAKIDSTTVEKYSPDGSLLATFGGPGAGDGQLVTAGPMAVDSQGHLYVSDPEGKRVVKFDASGNYLSALEPPSLEQPGPFGIAVDSQDNVYFGMLGVQDHHVEKWSTDGKQLATWGSRGTGDGQFGAYNSSGGPRGIAIDPQGNVWVTDPNNNRVQKFDPDGQFLSSLTGCGKIDFEWPFSVAVNSEGTLYVLDGTERLFECSAASEPIHLWLAPSSSSVRLDAAANLFMLYAGDAAKIGLAGP